MQSRQAVPVVPVAVRPASPAYCSQQTRPVKKLCPSSSKYAGLQGFIDLFVLRYQTSLLFGRRGPLPNIERAAHPAWWLSTPIVPSHIGQSHHPILLPTSNFFSLLLAVTVTVTATALLLLLLLLCPLSPIVLQVPGLPRLQRWTVIFLAATAILHVYAAISHSYQHCPPVQLAALSTSLVFAAHLCDSKNPISCPWAGVERDPLDLDTAAAVSSLWLPHELRPAPDHTPCSLVATRKAPTQPKEIRLRAQQLHLRAQGAGSTPTSGPSPGCAHHFLPEVAIRQT
ncbi:hypothetical protein DHEL01_v206302 [Diaporthe helianthi]|uniref:Uncharacterized protein n=1 Tax=Diaporthe helianthi TaxID=158607 RepID=A0A2P5HYH2_DIAHE|nr:hypothetical protein DHEL01_v206302 [Diaporthe helianthi]